MSASAPPQGCSWPTISLLTLPATNRRLGVPKPCPLACLALSEIIHRWVRGSNPPDLPPTLRMAARQ